MSDKPRVTATEIRFFVPVKNQQELTDYIKRIGRIIDYSGEIYVKCDGYKYMVGTSNDWWIDIEDDSQWSSTSVKSIKLAEITIARRYPDKEFMENLRLVIMKLIRVSSFQP